MERFAGDNPLDPGRWRGSLETPRRRVKSGDNPLDPPLDPGGWRDSLETPRRVSQIWRQSSGFSSGSSSGSVGNLKVSLTEKSSLQTGDSQSLSIHTSAGLLSRVL